MPVTVKREEAEKVLLNAFNEGCKVKDSTASMVDDILNGSHKTYRYVLLTGLLGKATNTEVNALSLQAGAPIDGAYDARTLCHFVIVPFERDHLLNALGGSNEPFANKPARFTHLSDSNAVRRGKDKETLNSLIKLFTDIDTSDKAYQYLSCALDGLKIRVKAIAKLQEVSTKYDPTISEIYDFIEKLVAQSHEGETCVLAVATLEKLYYDQLAHDYEVVPHKTNQSGASSKEVGDIDIVLGEKLIYAIEIKDKDFNNHDFNHAIGKAIEGGVNKAQFIYGPRASFDESVVEEELVKYHKKGVLVTLNPVLPYARTMLMKINLEDKKDFLKAMTEVALEINIKDSTQAYLNKIIDDLGWGKS